MPPRHRAPVGDRVIRPAGAKDHRVMAVLLRTAGWRHQHIEWIHPLALLGQSPFLIASQGKRILGALACPMDPPGVSWLRLFVVASEQSADAVWDALWSEAAMQAARSGARVGAALVVESWLVPLLTHAGFTLTHAVVFLEWQGNQPLPMYDESMTPGVMSEDDLPAVHQLDQRAFAPLWRHSLPSLAAALRQAQSATVLEMDGRLVGYQISTASAFGGHLARLAVEPDWQGRGLGRTLVCDVLRRFAHLGIERMTVNTQSNNAASHRLYAKLGFRETGLQYPVYQIDLPAIPS